MHDAPIALTVQQSFSLAGKRVWVAGHRGLVGSAIVRRLAAENCAEIITATRADVDLTRQAATEDFMRDARPDAIFLSAAKVGGILANATYPADFLYDNLLIEANVIGAAARQGVGKLLFLGSSCIYPKYAPQPIPETSLLSGALEPTNEWYAVAKIAGIKLCQAYRQQHGMDFISAMPTNLYGPGDNFDPETSHVLPALIRRIHEAHTEGRRQLTIWGSGTPLREFLHVDDCADALVLLMKQYSAAEHVNVGSGADLSIFELARMVASAVGYTGEIATDASKPDGTPRKLLSAEKLKSLGWAPTIALDAGIRQTYQWYLAHIARLA